ncbi:MAG: (E)-4-hydroxy-3-methylbut-2-enyl-diphosphate synthase [Bacteroidales bacterium]
MTNHNYHSRVINIGDIPTGGNSPIRIQSMTNTNTMDTLATIEQTIRLIDAGCDFVRITAPGIKEAENLRIIKKELNKRGYNTPLIADIHYMPKAAEIAATYVEKVRINPGNFIDRKKGKINISETEYQAELDKIRDKIKPLVEICNQYKTTLRIGANHGSLSERILYKYGDTPIGMVESALEFVRICEDLGFRDIVISMKSSNVKVMIQANRLLMEQMIQNGEIYPIHLGVTEAGDAEDGRIKSAAGIGPLLLDGIGDTIRVSLTEEPEFEIPIAKQIIFHCGKRVGAKLPDMKSGTDYFFQYTKPGSEKLETIGGSNPPIVVADSDEMPFDLNPDFHPDYVFDGNKLTPYRNKKNVSASVKILIINTHKNLIEKIDSIKPGNLLIFDFSKVQELNEVRNWFNMLYEKNITNPVILKKEYKKIKFDELLIKSSIDFSYFLVDGLGDGIWIKNQNSSQKDINHLAFGILQAIGSRISKTEYIACPSCGRTLFKIQDTLQKVKARTSHLKGLKIGVMGCCVNGPGEMADAHYGYVGAGKGKITLYKGKQIIKAGIKEETAVDELIKLIKDHGDWVQK